MKVRRLTMAFGALALIAAIGVTAAGTAFAQDPTPTAPTTPAPEAQSKWRGMGHGFGLFGGSVEQFDAMAKALNLTPVELFEQLHSGKSLEDIATAQGVDLAKVQEAANATRIQAEKDAIAQAVKDGKITQDQADWLLQGLEKGYMPAGRGGFGHCHGHGGRGDFDKGLPGQTPNTTPESGSSS